MTSAGMTSDRRTDDEQRPDDLDEGFDLFLAGIRTSLPGVQVLVAFLLVLPLQAGFDETDDVERVVFLTSFVTSVLSAGLLIAPSVHQRVRAPLTGMERRSDGHVAVALWMSIVGTALAVIPLTGVTYLATSFVFDGGWALATSGTVATVLIVTWFVIPLSWGSEP
jgi:hypothetical protein